MSNEKSFADLLSEAPLAPQEDTVSLVGALARSSQRGKFVLTVGPGSTVTLDIDAIKGYKVLGGGVGQSVVQVDLDRERVPEGALQPATATTQPAADYPWGGYAGPVSPAATPFALATPSRFAGVSPNPSIITVYDRDTVPTWPGYHDVVWKIHTDPLNKSPLHDPPKSPVDDTGPGPFFE